MLSLSQEKHLSFHLDLSIRHERKAGSANVRDDSEVREGGRKTLVRLPSYTDLIAGRASFADFCVAPTGGDALADGWINLLCGGFLDRAHFSSFQGSYMRLSFTDKTDFP
jgi:hypothetical protein